MLRTRAGEQSSGVKEVYLVKHLLSKLEDLSSNLQDSPHLCRHQACA